MGDSKVGVFILCLACGVLLSASIGFSPQCGAEFYRYHDQNGALRFTDNVAEIPPQQRQKAKAYVGYQTDASTESTLPEDADKGSGKKPKEMADRGDSSVTEEREGQLRSRKAELDQEFQALMKEKEALENSTKDSRKPATQKQYEKRVKSFNAKVKAYEEKRQVYLEELAAARSGSATP